MTAEQDKMRAERVKLHMDSPYLPSYSPGANPAAEHKVSNAAEYAAHQLGQIRREMSRIADALETIAAKP